MSLRFKDDIALLIVVREPRDVYRAVTDRQLELAGPQAVAVGGNLHVALVAAGRLFLGADTSQPHCCNVAVVSAIGQEIMPFC